MQKILSMVFVLAVSAALTGCNPYNNEGEGAVTGGTLGALAGGIIGNQSHDTAAGMLIGGAVGAVAGAAVGSQIQKPVYEEPAPVAAVPSAPAAASPAATYDTDKVTLNVPNSNGSYTAVVLRRSGNGYVGPQGEYYDQVPSTAQLQAMYGK